MANGDTRVISANTPVVLQLGMIIMLGSALVAGTKAFEGLKHRDTEMLGAIERLQSSYEATCKRNWTEDNMQQWVDRVRYMNAGKSFVYPDTKEIKR